MLLEVVTWGLKPRIVTGDSWYSSVANLKFLRNQKLGFLFGVEKNRTVSNQPGKYSQVSTLRIPDEGLITHLKEFGFIKLLRKDFKKGDSRHYILYLPNAEKLRNISRKEFITIHNTHSLNRSISEVPSNKSAVFVSLWYEILVQLKHTYFVHFRHLFVWRKCVRLTPFLIGINCKETCLL